MKLSQRDRKRNGSGKLHRRHLPFYMKPTILISFIIISLVGQFTWTLITAIWLQYVHLFSCLIGFALGIVLGYIHGRWTTRMWSRDYLRVLKREISFWDAKGATGTTAYVIIALGVPIFIGLFFLKQSYSSLAGLQSYVFGFIGGMNYVLYSWVRRLPR